MNKPYSEGLVLGRFQMFHKGHEYLLNQALKRSKHLLVFVGSADKERTLENPFSFEERKEMILLVYPQGLEVEPLNDLGVGDVPSWGEYVLQKAESYVGKIDCMFYGEEKKCEEWFSPERRKEMSFEKVPREDIPIHGTKLREDLLLNRKEEWEKYTDPALHPFYERYRNIMLDIASKEKAN